MRKSTYSLLLLIPLLASLFYYFMRDKPTAPLETYDLGGITTYLNYEDARSVAMTKNKPLLLWFTGFACVSWRGQEDFMINDPRIRSILKNDVVIAYLIVDDKTPLADSAIYEVQLGNRTKTIKTRGNHNVWLEIERFKNNAQPFHALLSPDGQKEFIQFGYFFEPDSVLTVLNNALEQWETYNVAAE